jgi:putative aldouronate transport system permease protein
MPSRLRHGWIDCLAMQVCCHKDNVCEREVLHLNELNLNLKKKNTLKLMRKNYDLYLLLLPVLLHYLLFCYLPMYGVQIAFKRFSAAQGIWGSEWVGLLHFQRFFSSYYFKRLISNTLGLSLYSLVVGFPLPIILALMLNEVKSNGFKRTVQTVTYIPHFLSTVVMVGMIISFLSPATGIINKIMGLVGIAPIYFMTEAKWYQTIYVLSGVWQTTGWGAIIFLAALSGIEPELYESARIDGATRLRQCLHITIPLLMPTAVILLILRTGQIMSVGFEKAYLMQNDLNLSKADIIATYVYRKGLIDAEFSFSTAVGVFNSAINLILLTTVNTIAKRVSGSSLW